jgi:hypothetical protein
VLASAKLTMAELYCLNIFCTEFPPNRKISVGSEGRSLLYVFMLITPLAKFIFLNLAPFRCIFIDIYSTEFYPSQRRIVKRKAGNIPFKP